MKNIFLLIIAFLAGYCSYGQVPPTEAVRNSLLGIYTGTYIDYATWPNFDTLPAGVKITTVPGDTLGVIYNDTLNNLSDTLFVDFTYAIPSMSPDTFLNNECNEIPGDVFPARDSIFISYMPTCPNNPQGEISIKCVQHLFPTGIKELPAPNIRLYPNPATDWLYITNSQTLHSYSIYNTSGQCLSQGLLQNNMLNIAVLPQGFYCITLSNNTQKITRSFIKQ